MPVSDFADLMKSTVQLAKLTGRDSYGKPLYGQPAEYAARISWTSSLVATQGGEQLASRGMVHLLSNVEVTGEDRLIMPWGEELTILSVERPFDETGQAHHTRITFR